MIFVNIQTLGRKRVQRGDLESLLCLGSTVREKQGDQEFEILLIYIMSSRSTDL